MEQPEARDHESPEENQEQDDERKEPAPGETAGVSLDDRQKFEAMILRVGRACFVSGMLLFFCMFVTCFASWDLDRQAASVIIGYIASFLLIGIFIAINGVYGQHGAVKDLKLTVQVLKENPILDLI